MSKKQDGKKKNRRTMMNLGSIHTGSLKTHPGILKAQREKAMRDSVAKSYAKKTTETREKARAKLKKK